MQIDQRATRCMPMALDEPSRPGARSNPSTERPHPNNIAEQLRSSPRRTGHVTESKRV
jgi:hypothetical protein